MDLTANSRHPAGNRFSESYCMPRSFCLSGWLMIFPAIPAILLAALLLNGCASPPVPVVPAQALADLRFEVPSAETGLPGAGPITRGDWFRRLWRERRQNFAQSAQRDQHALVFLGDSITHGWGDNLGGNFPDLQVANRGIGGDTSRGVLFRLPDDVLALHPAGVVLLIGTNDHEQGAAPEIAAANIRLILAALKERDPSMPVVLCTVFPSSAARKRPADRIKQLNKLLKAVASEQPQVTCLDMWTLLANPDGDAKPEEFPDLLHPNTAGYTKWAAALRLIIANQGLFKTKSGIIAP